MGGLVNGKVSSPAGCSMLRMDAMAMRTEQRVVVRWEDSTSSRSEQAASYMPRHPCSLPHLT